MSIQERIRAMNLTLEDEEFAITGLGEGENLSLQPKVRLSPVPSRHKDSSTSEETAELTDDEIIPKRASVVEMWRRREAIKSNGPQVSTTPKEATTPTTIQNAGKVTIRGGQSSSPVVIVPSHQVVVSASSSDDEKKEPLYDFEEKKEQNLEDKFEWRKGEGEKTTNLSTPSHEVVPSGPVDLTYLRPIPNREPHEDIGQPSESISPKADSPKADSPKADSGDDSLEAEAPSRRRANVVDMWNKRGTAISGSSTPTTSNAPANDDAYHRAKKLPPHPSSAEGTALVNNIEQVSADGVTNTNDSSVGNEDTDARTSVDENEARSSRDTPSSRNLRSKVRNRWIQREQVVSSNSFDVSASGIEQPSPVSQGGISLNNSDRPPSTFLSRHSPRGSVREIWNHNGRDSESNELPSAAGITEERYDAKAGQIKGSSLPFKNVRARWEKRESEKQPINGGHSGNISKFTGQASSTPRYPVSQRWSPALKGQPSPNGGSNSNDVSRVDEEPPAQSSIVVHQRSSHPGIVDRWSKRTGAFATGSLAREVASGRSGTLETKHDLCDLDNKEATSLASDSPVGRTEVATPGSLCDQLQPNDKPASRPKVGSCKTRRDDDPIEVPSSADSQSPVSEEKSGKGASPKVSYGFQRWKKENLRVQTLQGNSSGQAGTADEPGRIETKANTNTASSLTARKIVDKKHYLLARHRQRVKAAHSLEGSAGDELSENSSVLEQAFLDAIPDDEQKQLSGDLLTGKQKIPKASGGVIAASVPMGSHLVYGQEGNEIASDGMVEEQGALLSPITQSEYASLCVSDSDSFVLSGLSQTNPWSPKTAGGSDANSEAGLSDSRSFVSGTGSAFTGVSAASHPSKSAGTASPLSARAGTVLRDKRLRRKDGDRPNAETQNEDANVAVEATPRIGHRTDVIRGAQKDLQKQDPSFPNLNFLNPSMSSTYDAQSQTPTSMQSPTAFGTTPSMQSPSAAGPTTRRNFSFSSETTGTSSHVLSTSASESDTKASSQRTDLSSIMRSPRYQGKSAGVAAFQSLGPDKEMVTDEFVSESNSNVKAFQNAYQSLSLEQIANDLKEEVAGSMLNVQNLDFTKLASELNQGMSAASESLNKLVGGVSVGDGYKGKLRVPSRGGSPIEEGVAIEVEYIEDSDDDDDNDPSHH